MNPHDLLMQRRSLRAIDPDRPVAMETVIRLLEAARWAPSSSNKQPWRFVVVNESEALGRARAALKAGNQLWANRAPVLILVVANPDDDFIADGKPLYLLDCGLAIENLLLQGVAEGLIMHPMGGFEEPPMRDALNIPAPNRIVVVIAIGYPAHHDTLPDELRERELAARSRKPLEELTHYNGWNQPL